MWLLYAWGRDEAIGYGFGFTDACGIGVMVVICYEMLLLPAGGVLGFLIRRL